MDMHTDALSEGASGGGVSRRRFLGTSAPLVVGAAACPLARLSAAQKGGAMSTPDSYCGLYCGACTSVVAGGKAKKPEDTKCLGCKSGKTAGYCATCKIRECATDQGVESCGECPGFPCEKLTAFHHNGRDYRLLAAKNCQEINEKGRKAWMKAQRKRWTCPACKARLSWKDEKCPTCGADILSCKEEAAAYRKKKEQ